MKIYLDDERNTPEGFVRCYWPEEVIALLKNNKVSLVSLDHDLGDDNHGTGYDVVLWIEEQVYTNNNYIPPTILVHSANSSAGDKMRQGIENINKCLKERNLKMDINYEHIRSYILDNDYKRITKCLEEGFGKKHLVGKVLSKEDIQLMIDECNEMSSITAITFEHDGKDHSFFTNNHIFGYGFFPKDWTPVSFSILPTDTPESLYKTHFKRDVVFNNTKELVQFMCGSIFS